MFRKPGSRAARRADERAQQKLLEQKRRLAQLEPGGAVANPIEVSSASQIEPRAASMRCLACDGALRVTEHTAETYDTRRVRVVRLRCAQCATERVVFFRLGTTLPS